MTLERLAEWYLEHFDEMDPDSIDGDILEELKKLLAQIDDANSGSPKFRAEAASKRIDYIVENNVMGVQKGLRERVITPLTDRIRAAKTRDELEEVPRDKLFSPILKSVWTRQENKIFFSEKAYELTAEEIATRRSRSVSKFADFYNLEEDEARDILRDKGVLNQEGEIKFLEELEES